MADDSHGSADPVCGMTVDPAARPDLQLEHLGRTYHFCSKGCMLDFRDEPEKYLDPGYTPTGM
jgi:Cu+-exporting ATPase